MCVDHHKWWVLPFLLLSPVPPYFLVAGVLSSTLLPMHHRPRVFSTSCESATLFSLSASGSPSHFGFMMPTATISIRSVGLPWVRRTASPHPVRLRKGLFLDALHGFSLDIGTRLLRSARSTPLYHIAGLLFATYAVLSHASSPRGITAHAVALLMSLFRPER